MIFLIGIFVVFSFGNVFAQESSDDTNFFISGCSNEFVSGIAAGTCSVNGDWFCYGKDDITKTVDSGFDCATYTDGSRTCCPAAYTCVDGVCTLRQESCEELETKEDCESDDDENDCYWLSDTCVSSPNQYGCGAYKYEDECNADEFGLGQTGYGTDVCGTYTEDNMIIYNCHCQWYDGHDEEGDDGEGCNLEYEIVPEFCVGEGCDTKYSCDKIFDFGNCTDGKQVINFEAVLYDLSGDSAVKVIDVDLKKSYSCVGGTAERNCGEPIIKLPFFGFFNIFCVFVVLAVVYFGFKKHL